MDQAAHFREGGILRNQPEALRLPYQALEDMEETSPALKIIEGT